MTLTNRRYFLRKQNSAWNIWINFSGEYQIVLTDFTSMTVSLKDKKAVLLIHSIGMNISVQFFCFFKKYLCLTDISTVEKLI